MLKSHDIFISGIYNGFRTLKFCNPEQIIKQNQNFGQDDAKLFKFFHMQEAAVEAFHVCRMITIFSDYVCVSRYYYVLLNIYLRNISAKNS